MKTNLREEINNRLVKAIEAGNLPWRKPWNCDPNAGTPVNVASEKRYRGINTWLTDLTAIERGYASRYWGTYKQWQQKGCQVRKGEKGTRIVFYSFVSQENEDDQKTDSEDEEEKGYCFLKQYTVFNAEQVDGENAEQWTVDTSQADYVPEWDDVYLAESVIQATGATVHHHGNHAFYNVGTDEVTMPLKSQFEHSANYYSTLFHELTHWSGSRVGFDQKPVQKRLYALGELFAELGACYVCNDLKIPNNVDNSAAYLEGWLKRLKEDPQLIFSIAKWSNKSADFILGGELEKEVEQFNPRLLQDV